MNREQRRRGIKSNKNTGKLFDEVRKINKEFSACTDEILDLYNAWLTSSFETENDFLNLINNNRLSVIYDKSNTSAICYFCVGECKEKIGMPFVSSSIKSDDIKKYEMDLALILLHIVSLCKNEENRKVLMEKARELA